MTTASPRAINRLLTYTSSGSPLTLLSSKIEPGPSRKISPIRAVLRPNSMVSSTGTSITKFKLSCVACEPDGGNGAPCDPPFAGGDEGLFSKAFGLGGCALASLIPPLSSSFVPTADLDRELAARDDGHPDELLRARDAHDDRVVHGGLEPQHLTHLQRQHAAQAELHAAELGHDFYRHLGQGLGHARI